MSTHSDELVQRLAVPLVKYGESLIEDIGGYDSEEEIELTPELEETLEQEYVQHLRNVQVGGKSFLALVFEPCSGIGSRYVITDLDRVPVGAKDQAPSSAEAEDFPATRERLLGLYLDYLYSRVSRCESLNPTGAVPLAQCQRL